MADRRIPPPPLKDGDDFEEWEREIQIWQLVTGIPQAKQGASIYLSLEGKARECCKTIPVAQLQGADGVTALTTKLRELYAKDAEETAFRAYEDFETFTRDSTMEIQDYINEFDRRYQKIKAKGMELPEGVLAYRLLKSANISSQKQALVRATIANLTLDDMTKQLRAIFDRLAIKEIKEEIDVKPTFLAEEDKEEQEEVYYTNTPSRQSKTNPPDEFGNPRPCSFCGSIYHWIARCPDAPESRRSSGYRGRGQRRFQRGRGGDSGRGGFRGSGFWPR